MGHQSCGALELWNYPTWLRDIVPQNRDGADITDRVDLPALEIYRDRERKVARYNEFRRGMMLIPISKWVDLTDDVEAIIHCVKCTVMILSSSIYLWVSWPRRRSRDSSSAKPYSSFSSSWLAGGWKQIGSSRATSMRRRTRRRGWNG